MNTLNDFLESYKNGIPVTLRVEPLSVVVLCASVLVTALLALLAKKMMAR